MTRRTVTVTITADKIEPGQKPGKFSITAKNRDIGRKFIITEMSSQAGEDWAIRAFLALSASGVQLPEEVADSPSMASLAMVGFQALAGIKYEQLRPLLDDMFACVQMVPDPTNESIVRPVTEDDIEEITTRWKLRMEVFKLHADFS